MAKAKWALRPAEKLQVGELTIENASRERVELIIHQPDKYPISRLPTHQDERRPEKA